MFFVFKIYDFLLLWIYKQEVFNLVVFIFLIDYEEDLDLVHSKVDMTTEEDMLYDRSVIDGIEIGLEMDEARQGVVMLVGEVEDDNTVDGLEYPSFE